MFFCFFLYSQKSECLTAEDVATAHRFNGKFTIKQKVSGKRVRGKGSELTCLCVSVSEVGDVSGRQAFFKLYCVTECNRIH